MTKLDAPVDALTRSVACMQSLVGTSTIDLADTREILTHAARFAAEVIAPLNADFDGAGARLKDGRVALAPQMVEVYRDFCRGGWMGAPHDSAIGGQGIPLALSFAVTEVWASASAAFNQLPALTQSCIPVLVRHGPAWMQEAWIPRLVRGEWTGAMGMTEPSAGSDLGLLTTRADPIGEDRWAVRGQKIFNSFGDHDAAANVVSLVLARTPDAPSGLAGVSLFAVPFLSSTRQGNTAARNRVEILSLEHKLGFHASPTCVTLFGDDSGGAEGYLLGPLHEGVASLFPMLNSTRLHTAVQAIGLAERARQFALRHARQRLQGRPVEGGTGPVALTRHPDVDRMLRYMRAIVAGGRALNLFAAAQLDVASGASGEFRAAVHETAAARAGLLTPLAKSWCASRSVEAALLALQVFGGAGYIEGTGVSQFLKEAVVGPLYEGTNGIQALDFGRRKVARDEGRALLEMVAQLRERLPSDAQTPEALALPMSRLRAELDYLPALADATTQRWSCDPIAAAAGASDFLDYAATLIASLLMACNAMGAHVQDEADFRFFALAVMPRCGAWRAATLDAPMAALPLEEAHHG